MLNLIIYDQVNLDPGQAHLQLMGAHFHGSGLACAACKGMPPPLPRGGRCQVQPPACAPAPQFMAVCNQNYKMMIVPYSTAGLWALTAGFCLITLVSSLSLFAISRDFWKFGVKLREQVVWLVNAQVRGRKSRLGRRPGRAPPLHLAATFRASAAPTLTQPPLPHTPCAGAPQLAV